MEIGILILIILGSFIFKKSKPTEEDQGKPIPSKDMTWEEMEEYYGITLSRNPEEPVKVEPDVTVGNTSERTVSVSNPVDLNSYEKPVASSEYDIEKMHAEVHERVESIQQVSARTPVESVRKVGVSYVATSRKESLRSAARHGMVWSMILEPPKGARMIGRFLR